MWVLIDNYDSFTHILHHYLLQTGHECVVYRNDEVTLTQLTVLNPDRLIISPGPETPLQAGITLNAIAHFHDRIPILGVCLGHQALGMYFGADIVQSPYPMHGKTSPVFHTNHRLFHNIPSPVNVMRYHSLIVSDLTGTPLQSIAHTDDGVTMALVHRHFACTGVQFHPESVGTEHGLQLLKNWAADPAPGA